MAVKKYILQSSKLTQLNLFTIFQIIKSQLLEDSIFFFISVAIL